MTNILDYVIGQREQLGKLESDLAKFEELGIVDKVSIRKTEEGLEYFTNDSSLANDFNLKTHGGGETLMIVANRMKGEELDFSKYCADYADGYGIMFNYTSQGFLIPVILQEPELVIDYFCFEGREGRIDQACGHYLREGIDGQLVGTVKQKLMELHDQHLMQSPFTEKERRFLRPYFSSLRT